MILFPATVFNLDQGRNLFESAAAGEGVEDRVQLAHACRTTLCRRRLVPIPNPRLMQSTIKILEVAYEN